MPAAVYRMMMLLCAVTSRMPVGTNLGLVHLLWMLVSGRLLESRGAVIPGLTASGLSRRAVQRAWGTLGHGTWTAHALLTQWAQVVDQEGCWQARVHGGYHPVAVDVTAFWRPRLVGCPTTHYDAQAGKALPAIPLGLVARIGAVGTQRLGQPVAIVRALNDDPRPSTQTRALVQTAVAACGPRDVLVLDAGFGLTLLQGEGATRFVVRLAKNSTFRRRTAPLYGGRGRPPTRGAVVRPLPRVYKGQRHDATPTDAVRTWSEEGRVLRAEEWTDLVASTSPQMSAPLRVLALHDPRYREPLLLATTLPATVSPRDLCALYRDRWPIEQIPLAAKGMIGAARAFVHAPETCQRLPEIALLAGSLLSYAAATTTPIPTGYGDRCPQPTAGRFRRALTGVPFPTHFPLPPRMCIKKSRTDHLRTGFWSHFSAPPLPDSSRAA